VVARIKQAMAAKPPTSETSGASPLPRQLLHSALIVLASTTLFMLVEEFQLDLLAAMLVVCFALATLWLIPLCAWVVLAGLGWMGVELFPRLTEVKTSHGFVGRRYPAWDLLSDDDLALLLLAVVGAAYLIWLSLGALRGKLTSMLIRDQG
jgi:threonine/homoserine/homoserine lactone efflux protein